MDFDKRTSENRLLKKYSEKKFWGKILILEIREKDSRKWNLRKEIREMEFGKRILGKGIWENGYGK